MFNYSNLLYIYNKKHKKICMFKKEIKEIEKKWKKYKKLFIIADIRIIFEFVKSKISSGIKIFDSRINAISQSDQNYKNIEDEGRIIIVVYETIPSEILYMIQIPEVIILSTFKFHITDFFYISFQSQMYEEQYKDLKIIMHKQNEKIEDIIKNFTGGTTIILGKDFFRSLDEVIVFLIKNIQKINYINVIDTGYFESNIFLNSGSIRKRVYSLFDSQRITPEKILKVRKIFFSYFNFVTYHTFEHTPIDINEEIYIRPEKNIITEELINVVSDKCLGFLAFIEEYEGETGGFLINKDDNYMTLNKLLNICQLFLYYLKTSNSIEYLSQKTGIYKDKISDLLNTLRRFSKVKKTTAIDDNPTIKKKENYFEIDLSEIKEIIEEIKKKFVFFFDVFKRYKNTEKFFNLNSNSCRELCDVITNPDSDVIICLSKTSYNKIVLYL